MSRIVKELPAPSAGEFPLHSPRDIPPNGAMLLRNLRIDDGRARPTEPFSVLAAVPNNGGAPPTYNTSPILDFFNLQFFDGSVETIECTNAAGFAADYLSSIQRMLNGAWSGVALDNTFGSLANSRYSAVIAPVTAAPAEPKGRMFITNRIKIKWWRGGTGAGAIVTDHAGGAYPALQLLVTPDNRLFEINTVEGGSPYPMRVRWSVVGNALDFTGIGSGAMDLTYDSWPLTAIWNQAGRIFVGKERSIAILVPTGIATDAYGREVVNRGEGVFIPFSLVQHGSLAAFISHRDVVLFDGNNFQSIGGPVRRELFKRINYSALSQVTAIVDGARNRVGWGLPLDGASYPTEVWWVNVETGAWEKDSLPHTAISFYSNVDTTSVDELAGTVNALAGTVDALSLVSNPEAKIIVGCYDGKSWAQDLNGTGMVLYGDYISSALTAVGETIQVAGRPHIVTDRDFMLLDEVHVVFEDYGQSYTAQVKCSADNGKSWTDVGTATVNTVGGTYLAPVQRDVVLTCRIPVGNQANIRISSSQRWGFARLYAKFDVSGETKQP